MLEAYIEAGFDPASFWSLTLRLFQIHMRGAQARIRRDQQQATTTAYLTAGLTRIKKLPKLKDLLRQPGEKMDVGIALGLVRETLPRVTLAEWQARGTIYGKREER
ncbi:hypothetical protein [Falsirhodobacter xinxiangensis]|uniref:hypothetical protein n=1 Tax=Falsirhodobacter xinxiangensis TaxID=2530049 RepID=UPI0010AA5DBA|nr:hypothetical protein [Rhodobacter xinxiangensis]